MLKRQREFRLPDAVCFSEIKGPVSTDPLKAPDNNNIKLSAVVSSDSHLCDEAGVIVSSNSHLCDKAVVVVSLDKRACV